MAKQQQPQPDEGIAQVKQYVNKLGMQVTVFKPIDGSPDVLEGIGAVDVEGGKANVQFPFPAGTTLKQAFRMFEQEKAKAREDVLKQIAAQRSRIVMPGAGMPPGGLPPGDLKFAR